MRNQAIRLHHHVSKSSSFELGVAQRVGNIPTIVDETKGLFGKGLDFNPRLLSEK